MDNLKQCKITKEQMAAVNEFIESINTNNVQRFFDMLTMESKGVLKGIYLAASELDVCNYKNLNNDVDFNNYILSALNRIREKIGEKYLNDYGISSYVYLENDFRVIVKIASNVKTLIIHIAPNEYMAQLIALDLELDKCSNNQNLNWKVDLLSLYK